MRGLLSVRLSADRLVIPKDVLYLAGCVLYVAVMAFENSTVATVLPESLFTFIKVIALVLLCAAALIPRETPVWYLGLTAALLCFSAYLYKSSTSTLPMFFISMSFGSYGVGRKKTFSAIALTITVSAAAIVLLAATGLIPNIIRTNNYGLLKYDMGFGYGSQPSLYIETVTICTILASDGKLSKERAGGLAAAAFTAFLLWNFLTSLLITIILLVLVMAVQGANPKRKARDYIKVVSMLAYPAAAVAAIVFTACFNAANPILGAIDRVLSWRLTLGKQALSWYGVRLFGQPVYFKGFGVDAEKSTIVASGGNYELVDPNNGYTYVDSSYVLYLVLLGVVFLVIAIGVYAAVSGMAAENYSPAIVILLVLLAVQCLINPLLVETYVNPLPLLFGIYAHEQLVTRAPRHLMS